MVEMDDQSHAPDDAREWDPYEPPPPVVPLAAAEAGSLTGRRVIVGGPEGYRYDLRAAGEPHTHRDRRRCVGVLAEFEWYRSHITGQEVPLPCQPFAGMWVENCSDKGEQVDDVLARILGEELSSSGLDAGAAEGRIVRLDAPPVRSPVPARSADSLTGRRVVVVHPDRRFDRDLRAISEPFARADGEIAVKVCSEYDWYWWAIDGTPPTDTDIPIYLLWAE